MNSLNATSRFIYEEIRFTLGTMALLYITLPLVLIWCTLGVLFDLNTVATVIAGPVYGMIIAYGIFGYNNSFAIAVGLGSTRKLYLKLYMLLGTLSILLLMLILNLLEYVMYALSKDGISSVILIDTGSLFFDDYHFFTYMMADYSFGLLLFGLTSLFTSIFYRLGFFKTTIILFAVFLAVSLFLQLMDLDSFTGWLSGLSKLVWLFVPALAGLAALVSTYPIMLHVPLKQPGSGKS